MTGLNLDSPCPLYVQLEKILRKNIEKGIWKEDARIPSENELSREYGLSRMTVRSVLNKLAQEGLIYRVPGKGTFVSSNKIISKPLSQMGIRDQLEKMGYENETKLIYTDTVECDIKLARKLKVNIGAPLYKIKRVRSVNDEPFSIHLSYIPKQCCEGIFERGYDFEHMQLCDILKEGYGIEQNQMVETLEIVNARPDEAQLLNVDENYPLIHLENTLYSQMGEVTEYSSVLFRGDRVKIEIKNTYSS